MADRFTDVRRVHYRLSLEDNHAIEITAHEEGQRDPSVTLQFDHITPDGVREPLFRTNLFYLDRAVQAIKQDYGQR